MYKKIVTTVLFFLIGLLAFAEPVCIDGVCYPSAEAAREAGAKVPSMELPPLLQGESSESIKKGSLPQETSQLKSRMKLGFMNSDEFLAFLKNETSADDLAAHSLVVIFLLILIGGIASNLTPCVLPLVPVNLMIIGKGALRGAAYGLGLTLAYGSLGIAAAFGGMAFGTIQSNPWFNVGVAVVFVILALAMLDVFLIDFSKYRKTKKKERKPGTLPIGAVFALGAGAAVLAGACVEPILISVLLLTAKWTAAGKLWAVVLPFVLGLGMGLPWPFAAAGFSVLPKPGAWMVWVKRAFAAVLVGMGVWYAVQAYQGFSFRMSKNETVSIQGNVIEATPETWQKVFADAKASGKPILVDIWATWCKNCIVMEKTTLQEVRVKEALDGFTFIRLQAEDPSVLSKIKEFNNLKISGIPAFIVFE